MLILCEYNAFHFSVIAFIAFNCVHGEDNTYKVCSLYHLILLPQSFRSVSPDNQSNIKMLL